MLSQIGTYPMQLDVIGAHYPMLLTRSECVEWDHTSVRRDSGP